VTPKASASHNNVIPIIAILEFLIHFLFNLSSKIVSSAVNTVQSSIFFNNAFSCSLYETTSVTYNELAELSPESNVENRALKSMITNIMRARDGSKEPTVTIPIIEESTPLGSIIPKLAFAAKNHKIDKLIGIIPNIIAPKRNEGIMFSFFMANVLCRYCWSEIAHEISQIAVTIPKEKATLGSKIFVN
jgi:hypothetical protein